MSSPKFTAPTKRVSLPIETLRAEVVALSDVEAQGRWIEGETLTIGSAAGNDLQVDDPTVSRFHVELSVAPEGVRVIDRGSTNGTTASGVRIERAIVPLGTCLSLGRTLVRVIRGTRSMLELPRSDGLAGLVGSSVPMRRLYGTIEQVAQSQVAVLILGESGTGKERVAEAIHALSSRASGPLVTVDCGALTPTLIASELFGHEAGAFTGAMKRSIGAFEQANGGTLFFDEIGELPMPLQLTLLGAIERRRFRRVGGSDEVPVDVRIVSATNRDLSAEVNAGLFRLDLFYRLAVVRIQVPPLREHLDDLTELIAAFIDDPSGSAPVEALFPSETLELLRQHRWPGNVRELRNLVEATIALGRTPELSGGPIPPSSGMDIIGDALGLGYKEARHAVVSKFESRYARHVLDRAAGNVSRAARAPDDLQPELDRLFPRTSCALRRGLARRSVRDSGREGRAVIAVLTRLRPEFRALPFVLGVTLSFQVLAVGVLYLMAHIDESYAQSVAPKLCALMPA